jgi:hypothetical protein
MAKLLIINNNYAIFEADITEGTTLIMTFGEPDQKLDVQAVLNDLRRVHGMATAHADGLEGRHIAYPDTMACGHCAWIWQDQSVTLVDHHQEAPDGEPIVGYKIKTSAKRLADILATMIRTLETKAAV